MTAVTPSRMSAATPTTEKIQDAILAALADGQVWPWSKIRRRLPGEPWQQVQAAVALRDRGEVDSSKGYGDDAETYMSIPLVAA